MPPEEISITLEDMKSKKELPGKAYSSEIKIDNPLEMRDSRFACKTITCNA